MKPQNKLGSPLRMKKKKKARPPRNRSHPVFENGFLVLGHRGVPSQAPENTLAGFRRAKDLGANGIELDVRLCRTGELVVIHDARVNRTTLGRGFVKVFPLARLQRLELRNGFCAGFRDEHIPTLRQVFEAFAQDTVINVEIKGYPRIADGVEIQILRLVHEYEAAARVIVSSFNPIPLRRIRRLDARIATAFLIDRNFFIHHSERVISRLAGINAVHIEAPLAKPRLLQRLKKLGLRCLIWGSMSRKELESVLDGEIDGVITDYPHLFRDLAERGKH